MKQGQVPGIPIKLDTWAGVYNSNTPTERWEAEKGDPLKACGPASLEYISANKRLCVKQGGKGQTSEVLFWLLHSCLPYADTLTCTRKRSYSVNVCMHVHTHIIKVPVNSKVGIWFPSVSLRLYGSGPSVCIYHRTSVPGMLKHLGLLLDEDVQPVFLLFQHFTWAYVCLHGHHHSGWWDW